MSQNAEARWEQHNEAGCRTFGQGAYAEAEREFLAAIREATTLGPENLRLASSLNNLGLLKYRQRDLAQAEDLFRQSLTIRERLLGADHAAVAQSAANLATLYFGRGDLDAAEPLARRALAIRERGGDPNDPTLATSRRLIAEIRASRASAPVLPSPVAPPVSPAPAPMRPAPIRPAPALKPLPVSAPPSPAIVLQPFPESVLPVGSLTPIGSLTSVPGHQPPRRSSEPHPPEPHPPEPREHHARPAPRTDVRTPASHRVGTMRPSHPVARRAPTTRTGSFFSRLVKIAVILAIAAAGAWVIAGRPPLSTLVAAITGSATDRTSTPAGTEPHP